MDRSRQTQHRIDLLADDIGRLRRAAVPGSSGWHTLDRLADNLLILDALLCPSAAELAGWAAPGDAAALVEAIRVVDAREHSLRVRLRSGEARRRAYQAVRELDAA